MVAANELGDIVPVLAERQRPRPRIERGLVRRQWYFAIRRAWEIGDFQVGLPERSGAGGAGCLHGAIDAVGRLGGRAVDDIGRDDRRYGRIADIGTADWAEGRRRLVVGVVQEIELARAIGTLVAQEL